jgi:hypothetical protein
MPNGFAPFDAAILQSRCGAAGLARFSHSNIML